jgi:hypothetical protein
VPTARPTGANRTRRNRLAPVSLLRVGELVTLFITNNLANRLAPIGTSPNLPGQVCTPSHNRENRCQPIFEGYESPGELFKPTRLDDRRWAQVYLNCCSFFSALTFFSHRLNFALKTLEKPHHSISPLRAVKNHPPDLPSSPRLSPPMVKTTYTAAKPSRVSPDSHP